jgi:16S rRNA A1518/A1519 N6-dimethyltransferase RsmA/KsgA/DIM1 with predicted DNA glycosylase/AP lyase activity
LLRAALKRTIHPSGKRQKLNRLKQNYAFIGSHLTLVNDKINILSELTKIIFNKKRKIISKVLKKNFNEKELEIINFNKVKNLRPENLDFNFYYKLLDIIKRRS